MAYLLDTHVWIWSQAAPEKLGPETTNLLSDPQVPLYLATISTLELARLRAFSKVRLRGNLEDWVEESLELLLCSTLQLSHEISLGAYSLPGDFHRDPADRILVATARVHALTLLTADQRILEYRHAETHDARS